VRNDPDPLLLAEPRDGGDFGCARRYQDERSAPVIQAAKVGEEGLDVRRLVQVPGRADDGLERSERGGAR
jgi:hypothetical protein